MNARTSGGVAQVQRTATGDAGWKPYSTFHRNRRLHRLLYYRAIFIQFLSD
ncbi:MAG: hypothetical protein ACK56W_01035 [Pirellula sp.]|nr:hypothetical protein [Pirellula sp.]